MKNSIYFVFAIFFVLLICCNKGDPINNSESQSNEQLVKIYGKGKKFQEWFDSA